MIDLHKAISIVRTVETLLQKPRKEPPMNSAILGAARHILQLGAGALVARGVIDAGGVELIVGSGLSVLTLGWYFVERRLAR